MCVCPRGGQLNIKYVQYNVKICTNMRILFICVIFYMRRYMLR